MRVRMARLLIVNGQLIAVSNPRNEEKIDKKIDKKMANFFLERKMSKKTRVINLISGPGAGKTTVSAFLFYKMKTLGLSVEYVPEFAKSLVWKKQFDILNDQYLVSVEQYNLIKSLNGMVEYIITDGPLVHGLYYNRFNRDNTSNIDKTENKILQLMAEFDNINVFIERGNFNYETDGRYQSENEAIQIDVVIKHLLNQNGIKYECKSSDKPEEVLEYVLGCRS